MPLVALGILIVSIVAAVAFWMIAENHLADGMLRNRWRAMSLAIVVIGAAQGIYIFTFSVTEIVIGIFSMAFVSITFCSSLLILKTIDYMTQVSAINGVNIIDVNTGVYNETYLRQRLGNEIARSHRYGSPLSVVSLSVVGFSALQEEYGHQAGGVAVKKVADKLAALLRETDVVTSVGGGRFVLILPDTPESTVDGLITRLRGALGGMEVIDGANQERSVFINVKFGKSHCSLQTDNGNELIDGAIAHEVDTTEQLLQAA